LLGNKKGDVAQFSFLMVLIPIIGANIVDLKDIHPGQEDVQIMPLFIGFLAAFFSGLLACKLMIAIVKRSKLIYFAAYCLLIGIIAIVLG
jgi:undecaprenyl-diphosphatase